MLEGTRTRTTAKKARIVAPIAPPVTAAVTPVASPVTAAVTPVSHPLPARSLAPATESLILDTFFLYPFKLAL